MKVLEIEMNATNSHLKRNFLLIFTTSAFFLASCGSSVPVMDKITETENIIGQVEQAGASQYASSEFSRAQGKLNEAKQLADEGKYDQALLKVKEAQVDAELAEVKTYAEKADDELSEIQASIQSLKDKIRELNLER